MKKLFTLFLLAFWLPSWANAQQEGVVVLSDTVTGNQEQPKVLYIVPWQPATDDTILTQPLTTKLHRDIFAHIERPEHVRELQYLEQLTPKPEK
ncbi:hypothetical protein DWB84_12395 [Saccharophagus sp. K07]|jgi:hypothetical protein|uniref:hypothetical protein n=1 Tax=Saccharophagus sp. K07 TaxID=2283636 RepID=UPI0016529B64|nr:hypothetical protein [Saccharophagus sp. K07]MBC6906263.1 hypothetical protein [Saccharophagus sp. K07]